MFCKTLGRNLIFRLFFIYYNNLEPRKYKQLPKMTTTNKNNQNESLAIWKVKLELAAEGSYQAIQQVKDHVLEKTDQSHPIFKQSFYDILQQGYQLHQFEPKTTFPRTFQTYKQFPLFFLISGSVQVKCINLEGDTETISKIQSKGLVTVQQPQLTKKYGEQNINLITKFEIQALQKSILLQIIGSSKLVQRKQLSQKQTNIMRRFMLFPSKQIVRVSINHTNQDHIKDRVYLLSGKACYYLDEEKQFGKRLILTCYQQGYLNPKQFSSSQSQQSTSCIPSSFNIQQKQKKQSGAQIKLYIFEKSQIMYLQQNFLKDDLIKAIQLKRQEHLSQIIQRYKLIKQDNEAIQTAQNQLIMRFKLDKKQINSHIYKITEQPKNKGFLTAKQPLNDKRMKTKTDLISTSSSMKCSIRIRKSKKIM